MTSKDMDRHATLATTAPFHNSGRRSEFMQVSLAVWPVALPLLNEHFDDGPGFYVYEETPLRPLSGLSG
jgi:hypothetical protein